MLIKQPIQHSSFSRKDLVIDVLCNISEIWSICYFDGNQSCNIIKQTSTTTGFHHYQRRDNSNRSSPEGDYNARFMNRLILESLYFMIEFLGIQFFSDARRYRSLAKTPSSFLASLSFALRIW